MESRVNAIDDLHFTITGGTEPVDGGALHYEIRYDEEIGEHVAVITGVNPTNMGGELVIPGTVDAADGGFTVREISDGAFSGSNITSVSIPEGVVKIGDRAFDYCQSLEEVKLPSTIESIGEGAFDGCVQLTVIKVPAGYDDYISVLLEDSGLDLTGISVVPVSLPYSEWVARNGITGAWNEKDADGIANVFRYIFANVDVSTTPLIDIAMLDGQVQITTPEVVNSDGFSIKIVASENPDGSGDVNEYELETDGTTELPMNQSDRRRFYKLCVEEK